MVEVVPEGKARRRRKRAPRTWTGWAAVTFGTSKRRIQSYLIPAIGFVVLMLTVYWVVRE
ncbi:MAG: hypothetical protein JWM36_1006 [Hyphomicrobiales bacterium]|nr:hypothetical protein [Hyphomicrobiales bacterium]